MRGAIFVLLALLASIIGSNADANCGTISHGAAIPDAYDCSKFLLCSNGILVNTVCPQNYGFNKSTGKCEYNPACWGTSPPQPPGLQNPCIGRPDNSYAPYSGSCRLYYVCNSGVALLKSCPDGFRFDFVNSKCIINTTACT
ncbi:unnamed protein product [Hermetia illucens]|uniref:Chitin-binding type-2 domain-containing protein n=1 Tax=Hermetia illucens TaxID=343691 RepID=A0A7R8YQP8_HERIL|nr:peritrophin-1-like [Hermetia illucens]CAD7080700.1 unnamed protein product [Hermetia illucens]CAD7080701.1 unnamed protein product [Hermetia illucens]